MSIEHQQFWDHQSFAFVGHSAQKGFPALSYAEAKKRGKKVFPVDPSAREIDGDRCYPDLASLPERVEAVVLELPREETRDWVERAADAGIREVWIHMNRDTPEAIALAKERGLSVLTGTCAVMYLSQGFSVHALHRWADRITGKY